MPVKFTDLQSELGLSTIKLCTLRKDKLLPEQHYRKDDVAWFTDEGADIMRLAIAVPLAVVTKARGRVMRNAPNPRWVYAKLDGIEGVVPVAIPRRLYGKLVGKSIVVDLIKDANGGITYRHELLGH